MTTVEIEDLPIVAADDTPAWQEITRELGDPLDGGDEQ